MSKELQKSKWSIDGTKIRMGMEITKVDKRGRMIAGWATVDNVDQENDQVTAEASLDAFARSRMNLREMHKKDSAVGRIVSFKQETFRAPTGEKHKGIFVKVYVSKGAEDTWQKVLDGTLNGFSIGGEVTKSKKIMTKDSGDPINVVTAYNLNELSLVDNPGNQYSDFKNIFKIRQSADGSVTSVTGMLEDHKVLNVYYCESDGITREVPGDSHECPACGSEMEYVGLVEDDANIGSEVGTMVTKFVSTKGGAQMTKINKNKDEEETLETVETGHEPGDPQEVPTPADSDIVGEEEAVGEEENVGEVEDEGKEIAKRLDGLKDDIERILKDNSKKTTEKIEELEKSVSSTRKFLEQKVSELDEKVARFDKNLETQKSRLSNFEKVLNKVNSGTALRKSADLDNGSDDEQDNSAWNGAFSVKNLVG